MPEHAGTVPDSPLNLLLGLISNLEIYSICAPLSVCPSLLLCLHFSTSKNCAICEYFKYAFIPKMCH